MYLCQKIHPVFYLGLLKLVLFILMMYEHLCNGFSHVSLAHYQSMPFIT